MTDEQKRALEQRQREALEERDRISRGAARENTRHDERHRHPNGNRPWKRVI